MAQKKPPGESDPSEKSTEIVGHHQEDAKVVIAPDEKIAAYSLDERRVAQKRAQEAAQLERAKSKTENAGKDLETELIPMAAKELREAHAKVEQVWEAVQEIFRKLPRNTQLDLAPKDKKGAALQPDIENAKEWLKQLELKGGTLSPLKFFERRHVGKLQEALEVFSASSVLKELEHAKRRLDSYQRQMFANKNRT